MRTHLRGTGRSRGGQLGRVWALGLLVAGGGCATTAPVVAAGSGVSGPGPAAAAPVSAPAATGGATAKAVTPFVRGEAEPALRDGHTGQPLTHTALTERLRAAAAIYVGELHNSQPVHEAQLWVLQQTYQLDAQVAVGLEMLPRTLQPQLDAYLASAVDEAGFLAAVDWKHTWGFDFALYRPIFEFCRAHGLRMYALNAPKSLSKAVRQRGLAGLTEPEQAQLPGGQPWPAPEPHVQFLRQTFAHHSFAGDKTPPAEKEASFARFYQAQQLWDETMAQGVAQALTGPGAAKHVVVLAGVGHVGPYAMPPRATRRGVASSLTLAPQPRTDQALPDGAEAADVLLLLDLPE